MKVDDKSLAYEFCPGKATWYEEIIEIYSSCRVAMETGILPREGSLEDQDAAFAAALPAFIVRWRERTYTKIWDDVHTYSTAVLKAIFGKGKG